MNHYTTSAVSGAIATVPMTIVMAYLHKKLPPTQQYSLPPRNIALKVADEMGVKKKMNPPNKLAFTMFTHFGYGTAVGSLYLPLSRLIKIPRIWSGMIFGLGVWSFSYMGLLPVIGLYPPATKIPVKRNALMIFAHLVWGSSLGIMTDVLERRKLSGF
jgi:putative membrane protein